MKTYQNHSTAQVSGALETAKLTIEANGKAFKEFVSGIYSDKAYAICRELIANVVDSHVAAGKPDHSFDLHLPTVFDPTFSIRDYGTSMTHHTVMTLYRTLFRSSKDDPNSEDSNKYVGKFGLGSKSPWAYTDSFQLTAYLDGIVRVYDLYFNGGSPSCSLFLEGEMEEDDEGGIQPNGVLITFPVEAADVEDFHRAARRALEPLKVQPKMTGRECTPVERKVRYEGKGWQLLDSSASKGAEALQGTVLYPLRFESIPNCPPHLKPLLEAPFRIVYEIGQLDVITSREALSYDAVTAANVVKRLEEVMVEVRGLMAEQLKGITNYHDFSRIYFKLQASFPTEVWSVIEQSPPLFKNRYAPAKFVEVKTHNKVTETRVLDENGVYIRTDKKIERRFSNLEMTIYASNNYDTYQTSCRGLHDNFMGWKQWDKSNFRLKINTHVVYLLQDMRDGSPRINFAGDRVKKLVNELTPEIRRNCVVLWVKIYSEADLKALTRLQGYMARPQFTIKKMEDIALPKIERMAIAKDDFKVGSSRRGEWMSPDYEIEEYLTKGTVYYIGLRRGAPVAEDWSGFKTDRLLGLFETFKTKKMLPADAILIGFPQTTIKRLTKEFDDNLLPLRPALVEAGAKLYSREDAVYDGLQLDASHRWRSGRRQKHNKDRKTRPFIYDAFSRIQDCIGTYLREAGGGDNGYSSKKPSAEKFFEKVIVGTILEDVQLMRMMAKNVSSDNDLYLRIAMDFDDAKIEAERKEVRKLTRKLQHEANVLGGKAIEQFPMFACFAQQTLSGQVHGRVFTRYLEDQKKLLTV